LPILTGAHCRQFLPQSPKGHEALADSEDSSCHESAADNDRYSAMRSADGWKNVHHHHHEHVHQH
jgi:hypothetical protein